ncbi:ATP-binding cassette domain-containing protein [Deinococcus sp. SM5_A1]|uniref:ATP-binding cassette domain-containing protein n=1 Tax=Deinococcus sp. SM5_A1 TaxID=3379094 RepID=UPI00385E6A4E
MQAITVTFDGSKAITRLSLTVEKGSLRVLIGPNGRGKSTLLDTITGKVRPESGEIRFGGQAITRLPEHRIVRLGICREFQAPGVLEGLSMREKLLLSARKDKGVLGILRSPTPAEQFRADELLWLTGLETRADVPAASLAHGEEQRLESGMVLAAGPQLLLLDEPTAGMTALETARTAGLIRSLAGRHTVFVIDHDIAFVELLDTPITVLHQGQVFREGNLATLRADADVSGKAQRRRPKGRLRMLKLENVSAAYD